MSGQSKSFNPHQLILDHGNENRMVTAAALSPTRDEHKLRLLVTRYAFLYDLDHQRLPGHVFLTLIVKKKSLISCKQFTDMSANCSTSGQNLQTCCMHLQTCWRIVAYICRHVCEKIIVKKFEKLH